MQELTKTLHPKRMSNRWLILLPLFKTIAVRHMPHCSAYEDTIIYFQSNLIFKDDVKVDSLYLDSRGYP